MFDVDVSRGGSGADREDHASSSFNVALSLCVHSTMLQPPSLPSSEMVTEHGCCVYFVVQYWLSSPLVLS